MMTEHISTMNGYLICESSLHLDREDLRIKLHIKEKSPHLDELEHLVAEAERIGRPKAYYRLGFIEEIREDRVFIENICFKSKVLSVNLNGIQRVFAYLATCGRELDEWSSRFDDLLMIFWADAIKEAALGAVYLAMESHLQDMYQPGNTSSMNPGSLEDWPLTEQEQLFALLGEGAERTGVRLTESYLMIPNKSVSGLLFPTESDFHSCQLCPRELCPNRRAPYDPGLAAQKYNLRAVGTTSLEHQNIPEG